jgi:hypothetical protein
MQSLVFEITRCAAVSARNVKPLKNGRLNPAREDERLDPIVL